MKFNDDGERIPFVTLPFMAFANGESGYYIGFLGVSPQLQADDARKAKILAAGGNGSQIDFNPNSYGFLQQDGLPLPHNDCLRFANLVDTIADTASNDAAFARDVYTSFSTRDNRFAGAGFRDEFIDRIGESPNQVRHVAGGISFGFAAGAAAKSLPYSAWPDAQNRAVQAFNLREKSFKTETKWGGIFRRRVLLPPTQGQQADMNLNAVAVPIGFQLGAGIISRQDVGTYIRQHICDPRFR